MNLKAMQEVPAAAAAPPPPPSSGSSGRRKTVAVIGAGAAGLAALSVLRSSCNVTAFEASDHVGGVWNYSADPRPDPRRNGPMYRHLRTNLPKEIMAFPDWEWPDQPNDRSSFVTHERVLQYLKSYCYDQGLEQYIRLKRHVVSVRRARGTIDPVWIVKTSDAGSVSSGSKTERFDAVVVANGHFAKPMKPDLPGLGLPAWRDRWSHSITYRDPETFRGKVVALLGASSSGQDIALELSKTAKTVLLCHRGDLASTLPDNVIQMGPIVRLESNGSIVFPGLKVPSRSAAIFTRSDGIDLPPTSFVLGEVPIPVDHLMFCTGYDYSFPFLDTVRTEASHVPDLWQHLAHCRQPGLYFLGLCTTIVPFPQFYLQAKLVEALLEGRAQLPENAVFLSQSEISQKLSAGVTGRHLHTLGDSQWEYNDRLADLAGCSRLPAVSRLIYAHVKDERRLRLPDYKRLGYRVTGPDTFDYFTV